MEGEEKEAKRLCNRKYDEKRVGADERKAYLTKRYKERRRVYFPFEGKKKSDLEKGSDKKMRKK